MADTRIDDVAQLAQFAAPLKALGYRSLEQFLGTAAVAQDDLSKYLKIDVNSLRAVIAAVARPTPIAAQRTRRKFALGVRLDRIVRPKISLMRAPGATAALPPTVNLIAEMQPIRDQGDRGTCVAHASTAVAEHYWRGQGQILDLSRQLLYWDCKQHDGDPTEEGTWIAVAMARLVVDGCCLEATWPYVMTVIPGNESQDPPPAGALAQGATYKIAQYVQIAATSVQDIKAALAQDRCVAFSIPVFNSWYQNDEVTRTGDLVNPLPGEADVGGHAMCLIGYQDLPGDASSGGGKFYLRNSWGAAWATQSSLGTAGYGTIPYSYIAANCSEAYSIA
jgi:C1A family cysteine protease